MPTVIRNARIVNEGRTIEGDLAIRNGRIEAVGIVGAFAATREIDANGAYLLPGMIDDQVHFREPGFEHKGTIATESHAAVAGGITSYMEMPNCNPLTVDHAALADKHARAARASLANWAFYFGATNDNLEAIKTVDPRLTCGIKVFMGASTGTLLVPDDATLWHISLSSWFPDYVFYPLERRRLPVVGQSINILIVFLFTGLWHGAASSYILWGLLHGLFIALEGLFLNRVLQKSFRPIRHLYTLAVLLFTWLIFRAPSYEYIFAFLRALTGNAPGEFLLPFAEINPLPFIEPSFVIAFVAGVLLSLPIGPAIQKRIEQSMPLIVAQDLFLLALFVLSVAFMTSSRFLPGIYGGF